MRLVMFTSAIALGLVAGLSQASDWGQPRIGSHIVRFDLGDRGYIPAKPRATSTGRQDETLGAYKIGPALGYVVLGGASPQTTSDSHSHGAYGLGLTLPITNQFSVSGKALGPDLLQDANTAISASSGRFVVRAAFRF